MTKQDYKELGNECFKHLEETNPNGGIKEFIRVAVEFGYKRAVKKLTSPSAKLSLPRPLEAWQAARDMGTADFCEWFLEQEKGN